MKLIPNLSWSIRLTLGTLLLPAPAVACSSCGCTLTSDWLSQGLVAQPGTVMGLRYDYVPQTQLRTGTNMINAAAVALPADREVERYTYNHYLTVALDHGFNQRWAVHLQVPIVLRPHSTYGEGQTLPTGSRTEGLGDVRATVRFQGFGGPAITGIQLGLKLPTGRFHQTFKSGPDAGELVDRGLQPGTGTVDAIVGAYRFGKLAGRFDYLLQAQGEVALNSRDAYRPGAAATLSAGLHYAGWKRVTPQLQIDARLAGKDSGDNSDRDNSGGEQIYLAPGLSVRPATGLTVFAFAQLPFHQHVNGYQLSPRFTLSLGIQRRL